MNPEVAAPNASIVDSSGAAAAACGAAAAAVAALDTAAATTHSCVEFIYHCSAPKETNLTVCRKAVQKFNALHISA